MADRIAVMDHGVLQQVGTPLDVYNDPANTFVARFIGAPGMNLLPGMPSETPAGLALDLGPLGLTPPLPAPLAAAARAGTGPVTYGFRPENLHPVAPGTGLAAEVTFLERIGARTIVHLGQGDAAFKAVFDKSPPLRLGEVAHLAPDPATVRIFDTKTGAALRGI